MRRKTKFRVFSQSVCWPPENKVPHHSELKKTPIITFLHLTLWCFLVTVCKFSSGAPKQNILSGNSQHIARGGGFLRFSSLFDSLLALPSKRLEDGVACVARGSPSSWCSYSENSKHQMSYMYSENEGFYLERYLCQMQAFERDLHKWMVEPLASHWAQKLGVVLTGAKQPENLFLRIWNIKWSKRLIELCLNI